MNLMFGVSNPGLKIAAGSEGNIVEPHLEKAELTSKLAMRGLQTLLVLLAGAYIVQTLTPLRLCPDAVTLLSMASSAFDGSGFPQTQFPIGYPVILLVMERLGVASSCAFVWLNLIVLSLGLVCFYYLFTWGLELSTLESTAICVLTLLSWVTVKHVTLPLADLSYMCASGLVLLVITATIRNESRVLPGLILAAALSGLAVSIRWIGLALVPVMMWRLIVARDMRQMFVQVFRRHPLLLTLLGCAALLIAVLAIWYVLDRSPFVNNTIRLARENLWTMMVVNLHWRLLELGEVFMNLPVKKVPIAEQFFWVGGTAGLIFLVIGLRRESRKSAPMAIYLGCYLLVIFSWPHYDPRFWLPIIPLLLGYFYLGLKSIRRINAKSVLYAYLALFLVTGAAALWYSTRITLAGSHFPERYGNPEVKDTYRAAFGQRFDEKEVDHKALNVLWRYGSFRSEK